MSLAYYVLKTRSLYNLVGCIKLGEIFISADVLILIQVLQQNEIINDCVKQGLLLEINP